MKFTQAGTVVHAEVEAEHEERALAQAARVLSLDHDGTGYAEIEDPIVDHAVERRRTLEAYAAARS